MIKFQNQYRTLTLLVDKAQEKLWLFIKVGVNVGLSFEATFSLNKEEVEKLIARLMEEVKEMK